MVLAAPGGLRRIVVAALTAAALPVVVVIPRQVRECVQVTGHLAQTEALDARALAPAAEAMRPAPRPVPAAQREELRSLLARRRHCVAIRTAEQKRLVGASPICLTLSRVAPPRLLSLITLRAMAD